MGNLCNMKTLLRWPGGKVFQINTLLGLIPEHRHYCEVFGGAGSLLFNKEKSKIETYNDINVFLYNYFSTVRNDPNTLQDLLTDTPYCRKTYNEAKKILESAVPNPMAIPAFKRPIEIAWAFHIVCNQSFSGMQKSWGYRVTEIRKEKRLDIPSFAKRLRNVQIENDDFRDIIRRYDSPETFFFVDPPYLNTYEKSYYANDLTEHDHKELCEALNGIKGKYLLCGYENKIYNNWLNDPSRIDSSLTMNMSNKQKKQVKKECFWFNYLLRQGELF